MLCMFTLLVISDRYLPESLDELELLELDLDLFLFNLFLSSSICLASSLCVMILNTKFNVVGHYRQNFRTRLRLNCWHSRLSSIWHPYYFSIFLEVFNDSDRRLANTFSLQKSLEVQPTKVKLFKDWFLQHFSFLL